MSAGDAPGEPAAPRRPRKRPDYRLSTGGRDRELTFVAEFREVFRAAAVVSMKWRRSRTLDETDFDRAFDFLVASRTKSPLREVVAAVSTFAAGGALGYGVTLVTQGGAGIGPGWIIIVMAALAATLAALFQHWQPAR